MRSATHGASSFTDKTIDRGYARDGKIATDHGVGGRAVHGVALGRTNDLRVEGAAAIAALNETVMCGSRLS